MEYKLLDKQAEFLEITHNYQRDIAIYQGGFGSGKTFCGSLLGILLALKYPGCRGLVGAKEYELVRKTTLVKYFEHLKALGFVRNRDYKYNKVDKLITFENGSEIYFNQLGDPEGFKSMDLHWAEIEEASQVSDSTIKGLLGRLRNTYRGKDWVDFRYRLFGHTNPEASKGWISKRFVEEKQPNYRLIIAPTTNNIYLPSDYVEELKNAYDPEYYRINVLGEFGDYASGLVVKGFSDENLKNLKYNPNLDLHLTCDFNVDPMSWAVAHIDEKNVCFFDEIVVENTTTSQCIKEFIRRYPNHKGKIIINGDASGDNRSTQSEFTNYATMRQILDEYSRETGHKNYSRQEVHFKLRNYNPPIINRIASFNAMVKNTKGQRHLFVDPRKCKWILYNIYNLSFKPGTTIIDVPTINQIKNDRDSKFLSHIFDAVSYLTEYYWRIK